MTLRVTGRQKAFTLVEVLAATILAALLMLAVLHVIVGIGRAGEVMRQHRRIERIPARLIELLRWDLENARSFQSGSNTVVLDGFGALDAVTGLPTHHPARVTYLVKVSGPEHWLLRSEEDRVGDPTPRIELLLPGVVTLDVARPATTATATQVGDADVSVPGIVDVSMTFNDDPSVKYQKTVVVE